MLPAELNCAETPCSERGLSGFIRTCYRSTCYSKSHLWQLDIDDDAVVRKTCVARQFELNRPSNLCHRHHGGVGASHLYLHALPRYGRSRHDALYIRTVPGGELDGGATAPNPLTSGATAKEYLRLDARSDYRRSQRV